jgi:hypothetical protein
LISHGDIGPEYPQLYTIAILDVKEQEKKGIGGFNQSKFYIIICYPTTKILQNRALLIHVPTVFWQSRALSRHDLAYPQASPRLNHTDARGFGLPVKAVTANYTAFGRSPPDYHPLGRFLHFSSNISETFSRIKPTFQLISGILIMTQGKNTAGLLPISAAATQKSGSGAPKKAPKPPAPRLKLLIRRLPPGLTQSELESALGAQWKTGAGKVDWLQYKPGKVSKEYDIPSSVKGCRSELTGPF